MSDVPTRAVTCEVPIEVLRRRYVRFVWNAGQPGNLDTAPHVDRAAFPQPEILSNATHINPQTKHPRFDPVGRCIYCGATKYSPGGQRRLGDEHVIAEGMGGTLILPEASCQECEAHTSGIEWAVVRRQFLVPRRRLGLRGKKRSRNDVRITLTIIVNENEVEIELPLEEHPTVLFLPTFHMPGLICSRPAAIPGFAGFWGHQLVDVKELMEKRPHIATPFFDTVRFAQMIAKISHGFAIAKLGEDMFTPLLTEFIRRKFSPFEQYPECYHLVGGLPDSFAPSPSLHQVALAVSPANGQQYLICRVRLFGNLGAPIFMAVVGRVKAGITPENVLARAAVKGA